MAPCPLHENIQEVGSQLPSVRKLTIQAALLSAAITAGCAGQSASNKNFASAEVVDFQVRCIKAGAACSGLKLFLEAELPKHRYAFTRSSSRQAPYIQEFGLGEEVSLDSLEPPHSHVRVFHLLKEGAEASGKNPIIIVSLFNQSDTVADFNVEVFTMESETLRLVGTSGVHETGSTAAGTLQDAQYLLKSVVRYSYK